jgi:glycerate kinase
MRLLQRHEYDVDLASTFGVGEMLLEATRNGAEEIIMGLGGSATNDGGFGMARALGFRFFEQDQEKERELRGPVSDLAKLARIAAPSPQSCQRSTQSRARGGREAPGEGLPELPKITAAADVRNPLLGENGATRVFGPQKGATADKIDMLEGALTKLADVAARDLGRDFRNEPGAGAAGGLGFGLMSFCGAIIRPGFDLVAETVGLESKMQDVDLVITGEGSLDRQTLEGKTPAGVARLARKLGKRVYAIVGRASEDRQPRELFDGVYEVTRAGMSEQESIAHATELLGERARELARKL